MHSQNNKSDILFLASVDFSNSLIELKEHLPFNLILFKDIKDNIIFPNYNVLLIGIIEGRKIKKIEKNFEENAKILITSRRNVQNNNSNNIIERPLSIHDLNKKIIQLISKKKFYKNSTIKIKEYVLDKNEKKLKHGTKSITVTEKEIQLIELLYFEKKSISKKDILKKVDNTDMETHTVETHIYRLRKKIISEFADAYFINNEKEGYNL